MYKLKTYRSDCYNSHDRTIIVGNRVKLDQLISSIIDQPNMRFKVWRRERKQWRKLP